MDSSSTDPLKFEGWVKTDMHCHNCSNTFVAELCYDIEGNHIAECPFCGHEHCRVIVNGKITEDRWASRYGGDKEKDATKARQVWKSTVLPIKTSAASDFIRSRWLERGDY